MNLFHAATVWQLLNMYSYREARLPKNQDDWFLLPTFLVKQIPEFTNVHNVMVYEQFLQNGIFEHLDECFMKENVVIEDFDMICSGCSQKFFGYYLYKKKKKYVFFEDGAGSLERWESLVEADRRTGDKFIKELVEKSVSLGFYDGKSQIIEKIVCGFDSYKHIRGFLESDNFGCVVEDFNLQNALYWLSQDDDIFPPLKQYFNVAKECDFSRNSAIIFTQHLANLKFVTYEGQVTLYRFLRCLFLRKYKKVCWKVHPSDVFNYAHIFPEDEVITKRFPSEFLPYISKEFPETISSVWSSAIDNLTVFCDEIVQLSQEYMYSYMDMPYYYATLMITQYLGIKTLWCHEMDRVSFGVLANTFGLRLKNGISNVDDKGTKVLVVGDVTSQEEALSLIDNMGKFDLLIFLNLKKDYAFYTYEQRQKFDECLPVNVNIKAFTELSEDSFVENSQHVIYCYTKKRRVMRNLALINISESFKQGEFELQVNCPDKDKLKVALLEGQLAATQARIMEYIEREKNND